MRLVAGLGNRLPSSLGALVPLIVAGLRWWRDELAGMVPAAALRWLGVGTDELRLRLLVDEIQIETDGPQGPQQTTFPLGEADALPPALAASIQESRRSVLVLPRASVLIRHTELPLAAAADLHDATSFLVEKLTPFPLEHAWHAARPVAKDRERKKLRVELAVVPRRLVDEALARLLARGLAVSAVRIEGDDGRPPFDLLSGRGARASARTGRREAWQLVGSAAALLFILGPPAVAIMAYREAEALAAEVRGAEGSGKRAAALRTDLEKQLVDRNFLPSRLQGPRAVEALRSLTTALPDDVWVFRMEHRPGEIVFAGFAADVPDVLRRVSAPPFQAPELTSAVVHGLRDNRSRFEIRVRLPNEDRAP